MARHKRRPHEVGKRLDLLETDYDALEARVAALEEADLPDPPEDPTDPPGGPSDPSEPPPGP